ncbi:MAG: SUMF1/EgtB/PvdO family nonheme iron enzyme [Alphaproteobacteria bacterium]|nr:SUMF1/EgtB/PvdO family nonheme iron enzyme [Alphaproteobacteria bacterium]
MGAIRRMILVLAALLLATTGALAEQRIALVIGNSAYPDIPLANPVNDARLMSATLRAQGFDVIETMDAGQRDIQRAVKDFGNRLKAAQGEALGLFYYAGHGLQVRGENFLIPIDAEIEDEGDVDIYAISANAILRTIEDARNGLNIIILDACRNNPFARSFRTVSRGLALMEAPTGTLIAYSTAPGQVALDGDGANSPYTEALARAIAAPGISIERVFKNARNEVLAATQGQQTPWEASSLTGEDYYLVAASEPVADSEAEPAPSIDERAIELAFWETIKDSARASDFAAYLAQFPDGAFVTLARNRLETLSEIEVAVVAPPPEPVQEPPSYHPGESFRDCPTCPEVVVVPAGSFQMGSPSGEEGRYSDEEPMHRVSVEQAFAVGKYEVTFSQWDACVSAGGCSHRPADEGWGRGTRPVINVSWDDAQEYVRWLNRETGHEYRLLSEAEWEYAARAGTQTARYWGSGIKHNNANCDGCGSRWDKQQTAPVGSFSPNGFGLHDMLGNVWEWTQDCWHDNYSGAPSRAAAWSGSSGCQRVIRGGSWDSTPWHLRAAVRDWGGTEGSANNVGFRVSRALY